jgi:phage terminase large subunit-like protein
VGAFPTLEDQMCSFTPDFDRTSNPSPDRLDALVWALTDLMLGEPPVPMVGAVVISRPRNFPG